MLVKVPAVTSVTLLYGIRPYSVVCFFSTDGTIAGQIFIVLPSGIEDIKPTGDVSLKNDLLL